MSVHPLQVETPTPSQTSEKTISSKPRSLAAWSLAKSNDPAYRFSTVTCYDYSTAKTIDSLGLDMVLVGDSLAMTMLGHADTLSVTVDEMLHHVKAVTRGIAKTPVVADMPFMSYGVDMATSITNAGRFIQEGRAQGVKVEGASPFVLELIQRLTELGIPVMGHVGMTPQHVNQFGGFKLQGKSEEAAVQILKDAKAVQEAGAFGVVLELIPAEVAAFISQHLTIPTIGIGAGANCDGQILVIDDLLGRYDGFTPKFVRQYAHWSDSLTQAINSYQVDIKTGDFPNNNETFQTSRELLPSIQFAMSDAWALITNNKTNT